MNYRSLLEKPFLALGFLLLSANYANPQILPDITLGPESSISTPNQLINGIPSIRLTGGATRGSNLFHSFLEFSIKNGQAVYFDNSLSIKTIFSRITGNKVSLINGVLGSTSNADLFFINPNGIIFGRDAVLDINGSFFGSTANHLRFRDNSVFSANQPHQAPLLTNSLPESLEFEGGNGLIQVRGEGNRLTDFTILPIFNPFDRPLGLALRPNNTFALIGGEIQSQGGVIRSSSGRIELSSITKGKVLLNKLNSDWTFEYSEVDSFGDIALTQRSLIDTSGLVGGPINLQAKNILLNDGSTVLIQNLGNLPSSDITVNATDTVTVSGVSNDPRFTLPEIAQIAGDELNIKIPSTFLTEALGLGTSGNIKIFSPTILVNGGGQILARTHGPGTAGDITITSPESVQIDGFAPNLPVVFSNISTATFNKGNAGNLEIFTNQLLVTNGANVGSSTFGLGNGGDVLINAKDITLKGIVPFLFIPSAISSATFSFGSAGTLTLNTSTLTLLDGGRLGTSTVSSGNAGKVTINASQLIKVSGTVPGSINPSLIDSSANIVDPALREQLGLPGTPLPNIPSGTAGDVTIRTKTLLVNNGGLISVRNDGSGDAGTLRIFADSIKLENRGNIAASTAVGNGGNIVFQIQDLLFLNQSSNITTSAQRFGIGGNIDINSGVIALSNNSVISGNAEQASGGNIRIETQGLFISSDSKITASSQLGPQFSGNIEINTPNIDFTKATLDLAVRPEVEEVAISCNIDSGDVASEFTRPGSGGVASNAEKTGELRVIKYRNNNLRTQEYYLDPETGEPKLYPKVVGWKHNPDGTIAMTSDPTEAVQTKAFCSKTAHNNL